MFICVCACICIDVSIHTHTHIHAHLWRIKWQLTPVFLPGRSHEQRSLVGYSPLGNKSHTWLSDSVISSVAHSCLTLCHPVDCSTPGFPVHHHLPESVQTHVLRVSDAIQSSHPPLSPSPPAFSLSQHQGLFQ